MNESVQLDLLMFVLVFSLSFIKEVLERTHLSSELFNLYLHQNYLEFFANIDDVVS